MSIGLKLISGFLLVAALVAVVGYFGLRTTSEMRGNFALAAQVDDLLARIAGSGVQDQR